MEVNLKSTAIVDTKKPILKSLSILGEELVINTVKV